MGGDLAQTTAENKVEVVRIESESMTCDVVSLRARPAGSRIAYSQVDEYVSEFRLPEQTSRRPSSLRQLIRFLDLIQQVGVDDPSWNRFGFVLSSKQCNLECGANLEDRKTSTNSPEHADQYPDLASHYSKNIAEWYAGRVANVSYKPSANEVSVKLNPGAEQTPRNQDGQ